MRPMQATGVLCAGGCRGGGGGGGWPWFGDENGSAALLVVDKGARSSWGPGASCCRSRPLGPASVLCSPEPKSPVASFFGLQLELKLGPSLFLLALFALQPTNKSDCWPPALWPGVIVVCLVKFSAIAAAAAVRVSASPPPPPPVERWSVVLYESARFIPSLTSGARQCCSALVWGAHAPAASN